MTYESQEEADFFEGDRGESARAEAEYDQMVHEKEGRLGEECGCDVHSSCSLHEKKDWKDKYPLNTFEGETKNEIIRFIEGLLKEERLKGFKEGVESRDEEIAVLRVDAYGE